VEGDQRKEDVTQTFTFTPALQNVRFIKFHVEGTKTLPDWHPSAGGMSWVFIDEIVVRLEFAGNGIGATVLSFVASKSSADKHTGRKTCKAEENLLQ
jgi:hypothetical protein